MINEERQNYIFEQLINSLNACNDKKINLQKPILKGYCPESTNGNYTQQDLSTQQKSHLFDILGCFDPQRPDCVFLCQMRISKIVENWFRAKDNLAFKEIKGSITTADVAEVVYIHECAHYIHYHENANNYIEWELEDRELYIETFAQLLTHRIVCSSNEFKLWRYVFMRLSENQHEVYTKYKSDFLMFHLFPDQIVFHSFLFKNKLGKIEEKLIAKLDDLYKSYLAHMKEQNKELPNSVSDTPDQKVSDSDYTDAEIVDLMGDLNQAGYTSNIEKVKSLTQWFLSPAWSVDL